MSNTPSIAACQFEPEIGNLESNINQIDSITRSLSADVQLAVFPELCVTGYDIDAIASLAEHIPGPLTDSYVEIAANYDTMLIVGIPEQTEEALFNSLVAIDSDGVQAVYRKRYLWGDEREIFTAGDEPTTLQTEAGQVGFLICYDLNFPEASLTYIDRETDILAVSAAWRQSFSDDWHLLTRARALDGTCYVVGCNHGGEQNGRAHRGNSVITGPDGKPVADAKEGKKTITAEVNSNYLKKARERNPVFATRDESI